MRDFAFPGVCPAELSPRTACWQSSKRRRRWGGRSRARTRAASEDEGFTLYGRHLSLDYGRRDRRGPMQQRNSCGAIGASRRGT